MSDMNVVAIKGHLTKSAELSYFQDKTPYCNFAIGNNESYKKQDGTYENVASFFDCVMKGSYAEAMAKHMTKGRGIEVVGRLKQQRWEKDGQKYSRIVIKVENVYLDYSGANDGQHQQYQNSNSYQQPVEDTPADEYIPFNENGEDIPF